MRQLAVSVEVQLAFGLRKHNLLWNKEKDL
jgi:hypothetical protein